MAQLQVSSISSKHFGINKAEKRLFAEHSSLGNPHFHHLYDDACDVGIEVVNQNTGNTTRWHLAEEVVDKENEVLHWLFHPTVETSRKFPNIKDWSLIIYND